MLSKTPPLRHTLLRTPLLVMVFSAVLLCVFSALALVVENRRHTIENANRENSNIARMVGFHVSHLLNTGVRLLDDVANHVERQGFSFFKSKQGKELLLNWTMGHPELQTMLLIGNTGNLLVGASVPYPPPNINYSDRDYFLRHKTGANLVIGEQLMSRSHGRRGTTISRAIRSSSGDLLGVVLITIESSHFAQLFQTTRRSDHQDITILRDDGAIFVRFPEIEVGQRFSHSEALTYVKEQQSGSYQGDSVIDHMPRLFSYEKLESFPLVVVASQKCAQVLASWWQFTMAVAVGLLLALVLLGAACRYAFRTAAQAEALQHELERLAQTDSLTGLDNRRHFMLLSEKELSRTVRYGGSLAVLMVDIDFFKKINDTYGHSAGDLVLQTLSGLFVRELRDVDIVGRLGGEEFAIVLPQTDGVSAVEVAERLRQGVADIGVIRQQGLPIHFTISIGVATLQASTAAILQGTTNIEILLSQADKALYTAKRTGRNRVVTSWLMPA